MFTLDNKVGHKLEDDVPLGGDQLADVLAGVVPLGAPDVEHPLGHLVPPGQSEVSIQVT